MEGLSWELSSARASSQQLVARVQESSGVRISDCYQCGKCSAGCPVAFAMDRTPRQIIRLLEFGLVEEVLRSRTIWLCVHCETCATRCPQEVNLPALMGELCRQAKERGFISEKNINLFYELFLKSVERYGRVHEMGLTAQFNLQSGNWFQDVFLAPKLLAKGKVSPRAKKIQGSEHVRKIFRKSRERGGGSR